MDKFFIDKINDYNKDSFLYRDDLFNFIYTNFSQFKFPLENINYLLEFGKSNHDNYLISLALYSNYLYSYSIEPKESIHYLDESLKYLEKYNNYEKTELYYSILLSKAIYYNMYFDLENGMSISLFALKALEGSKKINTVVQFNINLAYILSELGFPGQALQLVLKFENDINYYDSKIKAQLFSCIIFLSIQVKKMTYTLKYIKKLEKLDNYKDGYNKSLIDAYYINYYCANNDLNNANIYYNNLKDVYETVRKTFDGPGPYNRTTLPICLARYFYMTRNPKKSLEFYDFIYNHIEFYTGERVRILDEALTIAIEEKNIDEIVKFHNMFQQLGKKMSSMRDITDQNGQGILIKCLNSISSYQNVINNIYNVNEFLKKLVKANTYSEINDEFKMLCEKIEQGAKTKIIFIINNKYYYSFKKKLNPIFNIRFDKFENTSYTKIPAVMNMFFNGYSYIAPIKANSKIKAYVLFNNKLKNAIDNSTKSLALEAMNTLANAIIQVERYNKLDEKSLTDPLTNLYNRYAIKELIDTYDFTRSLYFIEFDIDDFKKINDTYGHPAGDFILVELSKMLLKRFSRNQVFRIGGEEFLVLTDLNPLSLEKTLNDFENELKNHCFNFDGNNIYITISYGGVKLNDKKEFVYAYEKADKLLYKIKNDGKGKGIILKE